MQNTNCAPNYQTENSDIISGDSDVISNKDDKSSTSKVITIFTICYIFYNNRFFISILKEEFLLVFPICSLIVAILYAYICTKNIRDCTNRFDHFVRYEHILCTFGIIQILTLYLYFPSYIFNLNDYEVPGLGYTKSCSALFTSITYIPLIPLNIISSIIHIAISIKVKDLLESVDIIPEETKKNIIKRRSFSQISIFTDHNCTIHFLLGGTIPGFIT